MSDRPTGHRADARRKVRRLVPIVGAVVVGTLISLVAFGTVLQSERDRRRSEFRRMTTNRAVALQAGIARHLDVLRFARKLFVGSDHVTHEEFDAFLRFAIDEYPGLKAVGWIPPVPASERRNFEEFARRQGSPDFEFLDQDEQGELRSAGPRAEYFPIYYLKPTDFGPPIPLGLDAATAPTFRRLRDSVERDDQIVVGPLLQEPPVADDFVAVIQVSSTTWSPRFPDGTSDFVTSYLAGLYGLGPIIYAAIGGFQGDLDFVVSAQTVDPATTWAQQYDSQTDQLAPVGQEVLEQVRTAPSRMEFGLRVGDEEWLLTFYAAPNYLTALNVWQAWLILLAGLVLTGTVASYLHSSSVRSQKLASLNDQLAHALRGRDRVLRVVAHDLRDPLNTIRLSVGFLFEGMRGDDSDSSREQAKIIRRSVGRADTLIQDLLDVAKVEAGKLAVVPAPVDTGFLIGEVIDLHRGQAQQHSVGLEATGPKGPPPVFADRDRVLQVFSNLISNAIRFTPPGGQITVGVEPDAGHLRFSVSDTGPGIPREDEAHLFEPFWQGRTGRSGGSGLGLAIAAGIIEAHGGRIWAESEGGRGATFYFTLATAGDNNPLLEGPDGSDRPGRDRMEEGEEGYRRTG